MSRYDNRNRDICLLRQLGAEKIVLPIGDGVSISWLTLQVLLFFIACIICSCCSISSYAWNSVSASLLTPRPTQAISRTPAATDAELTEPLTSTPAQPSMPISTPHPIETATPTATSHTALPTPTSVPTPTMSPTPPPTSFPKPTPDGTSRPAATSSGLYIAHVEYNPAGAEADEEPAADLENELVIIENQGPDDQDMTGWTLNNDQLDTYQFPDDFILRSETSVRVWTKSGTDTDADIYWGSEKGIWGNEGGVAYLRDHTGTLIDTLDW